MPTNLRALRDAANLTQEELAALIGASTAQISRLERGERKLSKKWAELLSGPLKTPWPVLMGAEPTGFAEPGAVYDTPVADREFARLPEITEMLSRELGALARALRAGVLTRHAMDALAVASGMDRSLSFAERARIAVEGKAADIRRILD